MIVIDCSETIWLSVQEKLSYNLSGYNNFIKNVSIHLYIANRLGKLR